MRIGIDLGGTKTEGVLMDDTGGILHRLRRPTPRQEGYEAVLANIAALVAELEARVGTRCRVGIGTPGVLDSASGLLKNSNTTILNGQPLGRDLETLLRRPLRFSNDANCFALSEAVDGAGREGEVVFGVILGTGVGGGIVIGRRVLGGRQQIAGEWGHNPLEPGGPECYCGRRGCVETLLSGPGMERDHHAATGESLTAPEIAHRASAGEPGAAATLERYLDRFGRALAVVINIRDPDGVVLGGGMSNIRRLYTGGRERVAAHVFNTEFLTPVVPNRHGDSSGVRGAARLWRPEE